LKKLSGVEAPAVTPKIFTPEKSIAGNSYAELTRHARLPVFRAFSTSFWVLELLALPNTRTASPQKFSTARCRSLVAVQTLSYSAESSVV
jgi:hypothetical protein